MQEKAFMIFVDLKYYMKFKDAAFVLILVNHNIFPHYAWTQKVSPMCI